MCSINNKMFSADSCRYSTNDPFPVEAPVLSPENQHEVAEIQQSAPLSGKHRRAYMKRERRKRKRQALAKLRECAGDDQLAIEQEQDDDDDEKADEAQRERLHQEWLERERVAQEVFRLRKEKEEAAKKKKDDEERRIKEEWEEQQREEEELQEQKQQEKRAREEAVQKLLDQAESQLENGGSWKNPDAPVDYGTEKDKANCPFFIKTGACRFGERCSRKHEHPSSSTTVMVRGMFVTFAMEQSRRDDYDTDASLEYSEDEARQQFMDFYDDVLPEFRNAGKVVQFKVSCNFEPHLRGNVYVQYDTEAQCKKAFMMFNGRWYAGKQMQCEFSPVTKWKTAICGLFDRRKCPKGKHCNFLHVFQNPGDEFWEADRDLRGGRHRAWSQRGHSPDQSCHRQGDRSSHSREAYSHRWWRRSRSRSRERRSRSRSRERRSRSRSRESQRAHHSLRWEKRSLNDGGRSYERHRSHSRSKETNSQSAGHRLHADSRTRSCKSEANVAEDQIKNSPIQKKTARSDGKSPEPDNASSADANTSSRHRKRSKKSKKKKKNKKKLKRKRSKSCSVSSSAAGSGEDEDEETPTNEKKQKTETVGDDAEFDKSLSPQEIKEMKWCAPEVTRCTPAGIATETGPD